MNQKILITEVDIHIAQRLRMLRILKGYTEKRFALKVGISYPLYKKYEYGIERIPTNSLYWIACTLEAPVHYFYD